MVQLSGIQHSGMNQDKLVGRFPAIVKSYIRATRECRVSVPGITDGGDTFPIAQIEYAIGDKSKAGVLATEIEILVGDTVWIEFIGGDRRYPIITGWRNPKAGNSVDAYRRMHHANIENTADGTMRLAVGANEILINTSGITLTVGNSTISMTNGGIHINGTRVDIN